MLHALVISLCLGQTVYEWSDPRKASHFTTDPASIPQRMQWRVYKEDKNDAGVKHLFEWTDAKGVVHRTTNPHEVPHDVPWRVIKPAARQ